MSATLIIRHKEAAWLAPSKIFELVVQRIADQLQKVHPRLAQLFEESIEGQLILDLTTLNAQQFATVFEAARDAHEKFLGEWVKTDLHYNEVFRFSELKAVLSLDERSGHNVRETSGTLTIREGVVWQTEGWAYDLIIEYIALQLQRQYESMAQLLLRGRVSVGSGRCDLSTLDETEFQTFIGPAVYLKAQFINSRVHRGHAPEIDTIFYPSVPSLYEAFRSDPRIMDINSYKNSHIQWADTDKAEYPYQAHINDQIWEIRINDFPEEEMYTLIIMNEEIIHFTGWPQTWKGGEPRHVYCSTPFRWAGQWWKWFLRFISAG